MGGGSRCAVREQRPRARGCGLRERTCLRAALGARAPNWSSFLLHRSCLASALTRRPVTARRLGVFAVPWSLGAEPPFPGSCAFADAAIPRSAVAAIPRGSAGGGRHPPDRVYGHQRRGVRRTASSAHGQAGSGSRGTSAAVDGHHDASASGRARRGYQRGAATWGLLGTGAAVYGPARIAAPGLSGPSPSRGEAALVSVDRAAA
jgi:hypothetical protein